MLEILFAFIIGLAIGSFLNVVIRRIPAGESIVYPGSHCPNCKHPIRPLDNIPLFSYLILRGKCRYCHSSISFTYPLVELLTGAILAYTIYQNGLDTISVLDAIFASAMIALIFIDARRQILPDVITYPLFLFVFVTSTIRGSSADVGYSEPTALIGGIVILISASLIFLILELVDLILFNKYIDWEEEPDTGKGYKFNLKILFPGILLAAIWTVCVLKDFDSMRIDDAYAGLVNSAIGALIGGGSIWLLRSAYFYIRGVEGMGLGDIKLIAIIGAYFGWQQLLYILVAGSIMGTIAGLIMAYKSGEGGKTRIPLGVFLGAASLIFLLFY